MRVVFDTNIFVSALAIPGGRCDEALRRVIEGEDELVISRAIVLELLDVLARKFARSSEELARVALFVTELAELVEPKNEIALVEDQADNRILECAAAGGAEVIVTGDRALLELGMYEKTRIIALRAYLDQLCHAGSVNHDRSHTSARPAGERLPAASR